MRKICKVFKCFGIFGGIKFNFFKFIAMMLKKLFILLNRHPHWLAMLSKSMVKVTDLMVEEYIYAKHRDIYEKYSAATDHGIVPQEKIIWTSWLQGEKDAPFSVKKSIESMRSNKENYKVVVITLANLNEYLNVPPKIINGFRNNLFSAAHFTDYLRMCLLEKYGGIWLDATQFLVRPFPKSIWEYDLLVWNKVIDLTGKDAYISIPFVENFNNGFLIAKKNALFYKFAVEITASILFDPILEIDYFSNFKAYFKGVKSIEVLHSQWEKMDVINPYGLVARQFWNEPISDELKKYINLPDNLAFVLTYKEDWKKSIGDNLTVQEYILDRFEK